MLKLRTLSSELDFVSIVYLHLLEESSVSLVYKYVSEVSPCCSLCIYHHLSSFLIQCCILMRV